MENGSGGPRYRILVSVIQQGDRLPQVTIWGARRAAGPTLKRAQCTRQWADLDHRCLVILARRGGRFILRSRARPMNHSQEYEPPQNPVRFKIYRLYISEAICQREPGPILRLIANARSIPTYSGGKAQRCRERLVGYIDANPRPL